MIAKRLLVLLTALGWLYAGSSAGALADPDPLQIVATENDAYILELKLPDFALTDVTTPETTFRRIRLDRHPRLDRPGHPELPVLATILQPPPGSSIHVEILEQRDTWLADCIVFPVQPPRSEGMVVAPDSAIYGSEKPYPAMQFHVEPAVVVRGIPLVRINLYPFQWYPAAGRLRVSEFMRLRVVFSPDDRQADPWSPGEIAENTVEGDRLRRLASELALNPTPAFDRTIRRAAPSSKKTLPVEDSLWSGGELLKVAVDHSALYRLTQEEMVLAGADPADLAAGHFRLYHRGHPVAIDIRQAGPEFGPGDTIRFWGEAYEDQFTGTNVYWLSWQADTSGPLFAALDGQLIDGTPDVRTFSETLRFEENQRMWTLTPGAPELDYWYWTYLQSPQIFTIPVTLPGLDDTAHTVQCRFAFQGRSTAPYQPNHHALITLNELPVPIGEALWSNEQPVVAEIPTSSSGFVAGENQLNIELPGDTGPLPDTFYLNWVELTYTRQLEVSQDQLNFSSDASERTRFVIDGFSTPDVRILDITHPYAVAEITDGEMSLTGETYQLRFEAEPGDVHRFHVRAAAHFDSPAAMEMYHPRYLSGPANQADYLLITSSLLAGATEELIRFHTAGGLRTAVIAVEEIYNEFNHGLENPQAIKDFLTTAYHHWQWPAPAYVLLLGDATLDYRDYRDSGKPSVVPAHLIMTSGIGLAPDDNWYVCVDGDDEFPDMFIGRLPGRDPATVAAMLDKMVDYGETPSPLPRSLLLVADNNDPDFADLSESLLRHIPPVFSADRVYLQNYSNVNDATADIIAHINQGQLFTNYIGHGSVTVWAGEYLFESGDIPQLTNPLQPTVALMMSCINGYFIQPFYYCLAEEFVLWPSGGAVGAFAAGSDRYLWEVDLLDHEFFEGVFIRGQQRLGEATVHAKLAAYARGAPLDVVRTYTLFGDPALAIDRIAGGDISGDSTVDAMDLVVLINTVTGNIAPPGTPPCRRPDAADFNLDGILNASDILVLAHFLGGGHAGSW